MTVLRSCPVDPFRYPLFEAVFTRMADGNLGLRLDLQKHQLPAPCIVRVFGGTEVASGIHSENASGTS